MVLSDDVYLRDAVIERLQAENHRLRVDHEAMADVIQNELVGRPVQHGRQAEATQEVARPATPIYGKRKRQRLIAEVGETPILPTPSLSIWTNPFLLNGILMACVMVYKVWNHLSTKNKDDPSQ